MVKKLPRDDETIRSALISVNGFSPEPEKITLTDSIFLKLWKPASKEYQYTMSEIQKMGNYDSVGYIEPTNFVRRESLLNKTNKNHDVRWLVYGIIGIVVGVWGFLIFTSIGTIVDWRTNFFKTSVLGTASYTWIWVHVAISVLFVLGSGCVCALVPAASGSGVPEVMGYLNGVMFPRVFNLRTLIAKSLSTILSVSGGLPVGAEGPMIHIGSLIAAGISSGRSRTLRCSIKVLDSFRNSKDSRDFVTAGAASGITVVFCAPIGGLLFVMEEVASTFSVSLAWMVFFCCLCAFLMSALLNSYIVSWVELRPVFGAFGDLSADAMTLFGVTTATSVNVFDIISAIAVGGVGGLLSVLFAAINLNVMRFRNRYISQSVIFRVLEPCVYVFCFMALIFTVTIQWQCTPIPQYSGKIEKYQYKLFETGCPHGMHNAFASLSLTNVYNSVRGLFNAPGSTYSLNAVLTYLALYYIFASLAAGTGISHGLLIPTVVIGATYGRACGILYEHLLLFINPKLKWVKAGTFAVLGCASFFAGMSRLTFSLIVIMMEMTHDLSNVLGLMFAVWSAKALAELLTPSYYESVLRTKSVPFLHKEHSNPDMIIHSVKTIMSKPVRFLQCISPMNEITCILQETSHSGFPVVTTSGHYCGLITRSQLEEILWFIVLSNKSKASKESEMKPATYEDLRKIREYMFWNRSTSATTDCSIQTLAAHSIDLRPYVDTSAIAISILMSMERAYSIFLSLNLRQLVITDLSNRPVGMITRKDLVANNINERLIASKAEFRLQEDLELQMNQQSSPKNSNTTLSLASTSLPSPHEDNIPSSASTLLYPNLIIPNA